MLISTEARPEDTCRTKISAGIANNPFPPHYEGEAGKESLSGYPTQNKISQLSTAGNPMD